MILGAVCACGLQLPCLSTFDARTALQTATVLAIAAWLVAAIGFEQALLR
jgi:hypothetical protein